MPITVPINVTMLLVMVAINGMWRTVGSCVKYATTAVIFRLARYAAILAALDEKARKWNSYLYDQSSVSHHEALRAAQRPVLARPAGHCLTDDKLISTRRAHQLFIDIGAWWPLIIDGSRASTLIACAIWYAEVTNRIYLSMRGYE